MDNHMGKGRGGNGEKYGWYISEGCELHKGEVNWDRTEAADKWGDNNGQK